MGNGVRLLLPIMLLGLSLVACAASETNLGGRYYLNDSDAAHVYIVKKSDEKKEYDTVVVDQQVVDIKVVHGYLLALRKVADSVGCYDDTDTPTIITHYSDKDEYWIIDLKNENEIGPLSEQSYFEMQKQLGLPAVKLRVPSDFVSNSEAFKKWSKDCKRLVR